MIYFILMRFYTLLINFIAFSFLGHREYDVVITNKQQQTTLQHQALTALLGDSLQFFFIGKGEIVQWNRLAKHTGSTAEQSGIRENAHDRRLQVCGTSI